MIYCYPLFLLFALGITWGSGYVIARVATLNGITPLAYSFWQSLGPAVFLMLLLLIRGIRLPLSKKHLQYYVVCGLLGIALPNTNMYFAAPHLPSGLLAVIVNIAPVLTYFFALAIKQEKFNLVRFAGVILGLAGIFMVVAPKATIPGADNMPWVLLSLLSPLFFASCAVYINAQRPTDADSLALSAGMLITSTLALIPVVAVHHDFYLPKLPLQLGDWMILLEIILSSLGYIIMFELLKRAGPVFYSFVSGIVLLTGLAWGWIIYRETINLTEILAVILILLAIVLVSIRQNRQSLSG